MPKHMGGDKPKLGDGVASIGKTGNVKNFDSGGGGKHSFLPDHYEGAKGNSKSGTSSGSTKPMKIPFLPDKPE